VKFWVNSAFHNLKKIRKMILVGASGFEPETSCAQGSRKKSILLARLALFCVMVLGFGPNSAAFGPKLDPSFRLHPSDETVFDGHTCSF